jgi:hypothetical protein
MVFRVPALPHQCERCGVWYRSHAVWEWATDAIMTAAFAAIIGLAWSHRLPKVWAVILGLVVLAASYLFFPYITPFVYARPPENDKSNVAN